MTVTPLHDCFIVQRIEEGEQILAGIIVPDSTKEKPQRGKIFAIGLGRIRDDDSRQQPNVKGRRHDPVREVLEPGNHDRR